jgi:predicted NUDIX family NTP pyrophosphohydrolase
VGKKQRISAGLLMYRVQREALQVLLGHPGGPFYAHKDSGHWTIPKGEPHPGEDLLKCAQREFVEETGILPRGPYEPLGTISQAGGKVVHAWAFAGDLHAGDVIKSTTFELEWPAGSGRTQSFPEMDQAKFFGLKTAQEKLKPSQWPLVERLVTHLSKTPSP